MTVYLPDTTVLIGFGRSRPVETEWMRRALNSADTVISCPPSRSRSASRARLQPNAVAGKKCSECCGSSHSTGATRFLAGTYRYDLARRARPIALGDSLIAAVARALARSS